MKGKQAEPSQRNGSYKGKNDCNKAVVIVNDQVAGGGGTDSTGGTNAAIESANTKQQHAVGGRISSVAFNKSGKSKQKGTAKKDGRFELTPLGYARNANRAERDFIKGRTASA